MRRTGDVERTESIDGCLKRAIAGKRLVEIGYHGSVRAAEPHDYGLQNGAARLLIYQLRGPTGRDGKVARGWRLLDVAKISACVVLEETFRGSRGAMHDQHHAWDVVYARVT